MLGNKFSSIMPKKRTKFGVRMKEVSLKIVKNMTAAGKRIMQLVKKSKSKNCPRNINASVEKIVKEEESGKKPQDQMGDEKVQQKLVVHNNYNATHCFDNICDWKKAKPEIDVKVIDSRVDTNHLNTESETKKFCSLKKLLSIGGELNLREKGMHHERTEKFYLITAASRIARVSSKKRPLNIEYSGIQTIINFLIIMVKRYISWKYRKRKMHSKVCKNLHC